MSSMDKVKSAVSKVSNQISKTAKKTIEVIDSIDMLKYQKAVLKLLAFSRSTSLIALNMVPGLDPADKELIMLIHKVAYDKVITPELLQTIFQIVETAKVTALSVFKKLSGELKTNDKYDDFANKIFKTIGTGKDLFDKLKDVKNFDPKTLKLLKVGGAADKNEELYKKKALKYKQKYLMLKNKNKK